MNTTKKYKNTLIKKSKNKCYKTFTKLLNDDILVNVVFFMTIIYEVFN